MAVGDTSDVTVRRTFSLTRFGCASAWPSDERLPFGRSASYDPTVPRGRQIAARLGLISVFGMPILILGGMLEWLIPATSTHAAGHGLGFAVLGAYPFLFLWLGAALLTARRVARLPQSWADATLPGPVAALQWVLVAVALLGGIPLLTFDLAPDPSSVAAGVLTSTVFPVVVIGASIAQFAVLGRSRSDSQAMPSGTAAAILGHARFARTSAAVVAVTCVVASAAFLVEELHRLATGHAGDYGIVPFLLLVAVTAAGLPYSWIVAAIAFLLLVARPMAGVGPAPAALDTTAAIAITVPAVVNAIRAARIGVSQNALAQWVHRRLDRAQPGPLQQEARTH